MHLFQSFVAIAAVLDAVLAAPSPDPLLRAVRGRKTFTFEQKPVERGNVWRGPMSMRRAYLKYGLEPPGTIQTAARMVETRPPGQTSVGVRPVKGDVEYLITVRVGNHNMSLDLDTGSSDLYVLLPSPQPEVEKLEDSQDN
jgi:aspergillopepsin I